MWIACRHKVIDVIYILQIASKVWMKKSCAQELYRESHIFHIRKKIISVQKLYRLCVLNFKHMQGDTIGCYISLGQGGRPFEKGISVSFSFPFFNFIHPNFNMTVSPEKYRHQHWICKSFNMPCTESNAKKGTFIKACAINTVECLLTVARPSSWFQSSFGVQDVVFWRGQTWLKEADNPELPKPLSGSFVAFSKNGVWQGIAYRYA